MAIRFGPFVLDSESRRLLRDAQQVRLRPKAFDLLVVLATNRPKAVPKSRLLETLWAGTFVSESNLATLVTEIRDALGDNTQAPRFIRTVHRFGYAFCGDAIEVPESAPHPTRRCCLMRDDRPIPLSTGDNILGRDEDATLWLDGPSISRFHARIHVSAAGAVLEDLGSKNGTYLGEHKVTEPMVLKDGDEIRLGLLVLTFRIPREAQSTKTRGKEC